MKKILNFGLILVLIVLLTGCGKIENKFDIGEISDIEVSTSNDISMVIKEGTLTNKGATIIITNNSDKDFIYGNPYEIEIKKDGEWHKINVELLFNSLGIILKSKESKEIKINWKDGYGKLASGTYRIIKSVSYEYEKDNYQTFDIAVEFNITNE